MDTGGVRAARGSVRPELLTRLLAEPYYALRPPKSTGKELFNADYLHQCTADFATDNVDAMVATLTE
jgi:anhydro-N-acetylmuramic acid kinase